MSPILSYTLGFYMVPNQFPPRHIANSHGDAPIFSSNASYRRVFEDEEAAFPPDFTGGHHNMFVYSDLVDHQVVGDTNAPLLCVVNINSALQYGGTISKKYIKPYYVDICKSTIDTVHVAIRRVDGTLFPFHSGSPLPVKLHMRPKLLSS